VTKKTPITGSIVISIPSCPSTPVAWSATVYPEDPRTPFFKGSATLTANTSLRDPFYGEFVYGDPVSTSAYLKES
jgi:hypothetical protein